MQKKILIVDDEPEIVSLLKDRFVYEGFDVVVAFDGVEAKHSIDELKPKVIILDLKMPIESGIKVLQHLQLKQIPNYDPMVIVLSAMVDDQVKANALSLGAKVFYAKPCDLSVLVSRVKDLLKE